MAAFCPCRLCSFDILLFSTVLLAGQSHANLRDKGLRVGGLQGVFWLMQGPRGNMHEHAKDCTVEGLKDHLHDIVLSSQGHVASLSLARTFRMARAPRNS